MIKCCTKEGSLDLSAHGEVTEILADLGLIVSEIYKEIHGENAKEYFKDVFESGLFAGLAFAEDEKDRSKIVLECIRKRANSDEFKNAVENEDEARKSELKQIGEELETLVKLIKDL